MTTREVEWDQQQQLWALALDMYRGLTCGGCGHYLPDSTAKDAETRYVADLPTRCHACTAQRRAVKEHLDAPHDAHPEALMWPVLRR